MRCEFDCIETPLRSFFFRYAAFVARNPWPFVIVPVVFSAICGIGFGFRILEVDAIYLYTPSNAPSKLEKQIIYDHFPQTDGNFQPERAGTDEKSCIVIVSATDGGNILRTHYGKEVERLNKFVLENITVHADNRSYTFQDICMLATNFECWKNPTVPFVNTLSDHLPKNLTYPQILFGQKMFYLGSTLGGVELKSDGKHVAGAKAWQLVYQLRYDGTNYSRLSLAWEQEFRHRMSGYTSDWVNFTYFHSQTLNEELLRNVDKVTPKFAITFMVLVLFAVLSTTSVICLKPTTLCGLRIRSFVIDWVVGKPILAILGVVNAGLGAVAGIGFLTICRYHYNDIVAVMPFLVVSICAEYMFLMTGAWRRTNRTHSVEERLSESISIHAVSIVIAMGTGALSFAIGAITTIPAIQIFCIYSCVSMFFALHFQFTFFAGALALFGRLEERSRHCLTMAQCIPADKIETANTFRRIFGIGSVPDFANVENPANYTTSQMDRFFEDRYSPVLMHPLTKFLVFVVFCVYLAVGAWGCLQLREGLKPVNLLVGDSYAVGHYRAMEDYFLPYGQEFQVVVSNASHLDLATARGKDKLMQVVSAFANSKHSVGMEGVQLFLFEYYAFLRQFKLERVAQSDPRQFYVILKDNFLKTTVFSDRRVDVVWDTQDPYKISAFRFSVGMRNFVESSDQVETMMTTREIASRYPELNLSTYNFLYQFADQYRLILPNTLENITIALFVMLFVSALLIPHPLCSFCVAVTIVSIDVGVVGYMTLWGVNLDAISMITIIMSVGFSVDFTAHVSYGYVVLSQEEDPVKRMQITLGARGWPVTQACLATIFGILALAGVPAYMIVTFFKTVFLVMVIGLIHAIVFLPVMLDVLIRPVLACAGKPQSSSSSDNQQKDQLKHSENVSSGKNNGHHSTGEPVGFLWYQKPPNPPNEVGAHTAALNKRLAAEETNGFFRYS